MSKYAHTHEQVNGPGDARPTAMQILKDEDMLGKLEGMVAIVTGGSSGLGIETAKALYETGARIILTARDVAKGEEVAKEIEKHGQSKAKIDVLKLELDSLDSVRQCAAEFKKLSPTLNLLICNAGVMAPAEGATKDGFETQFGTNYVGHFLLFQLLKDQLLSSSSSSFPSRVVCLSSSGHRQSSVRFDDLDFKKGGYDPWLAYGQSKTAVIYMANEIERRYGSKGLHATSLHPGAIHTNLSRHMEPAAIENFMTPEIKKQSKSPEQGAATIVWAAVGKEWKDKGGKYLDDCQVSKPVDDPQAITPVDPGYVPHIYNEEAARKLWKVSNELVGLQQEAD